MAHTHRPIIQKPHLSKSYIDNKGFQIDPAKYQPAIFLFILLFILVCILLFSNLGAPPIYIVDEARNAQCAKEMMQHHNLIIPTFNGQLRTDKPPLSYYFMIGAYKMFGVSSFSARFFSGVMGLLTIIITTVFVNRFLNRKAAFFSAVVLLCSTHFLFEFRLAVPDPYLIFFTAAGLMSGFVWLTEHRPAFLYLSAVSLALASLAKGPVALILPILCFFAFAIYKKNLKKIFTLHLLLSSLLFIIIVLPWYFLVHRETNGAWTTAFFMDHNINRFSTSREGHGGFFLLPLIIALLGLLPFSGFTASIVRKKKFLFSNEVLAFSTIVFSVIIVFFSFSKTQLPNYAMPAYPFAAIIIGNFLSKKVNTVFEMPAYPLYIIAAFLCILPVGIYLALLSEVQTKHVASIAAILIMPIVLSSVLLIKKNRFTNTSIMHFITGIFFVFNLVILTTIYPVAYRNNPVTKTIDIVKSGKMIVAFGHYNPAFNFYLNNTVKKLEATQIDSLNTLPQGTIILTCSTHFHELESLHLNLLAREHDIFEGRETLIFSK